MMRKTCSQGVCSSAAPSAASQRSDEKLLKDLEACMNDPGRQHAAQSRGLGESFELEAHLSAQFFVHHVHGRDTSIRSAPALRICGEGGEGGGPMVMATSCHFWHCPAGAALAPVQPPEPSHSSSPAPHTQAGSCCASASGSAAHAGHRRSRGGAHPRRHKPCTARHPLRLEADSRLGRLLLVSSGLVASRFSRGA